LSPLSYQCEHARAHEPRDQKIHFDLCCDSWRGRTVRELPYFDKLYRYFDALHEGRHINLALEVEGAELLTASSSGGIAQEALNEMRLILRYIKCMRELLALWKLHVPFSDTPIPTTAVKQVFELWSLLCARPMLPWKRLSPGHCDVTPQNYTEATALRTTLESAQPLAIKIGREFPEPVNLMGSYVSLNPVRLYYSQVKLQADVPTADVKAGKSLRLAVVPMQDCVFSVEQSEPPCVLVTGPEKTIESAGEVDATACVDLG
jgi:hypothetical protein